MKDAVAMASARLARGAGRARSIVGSAAGAAVSATIRLDAAMRRCPIASAGSTRAAVIRSGRRVAPCWPTSVAVVTAIAAQKMERQVATLRKRRCVFAMQNPIAATSRGTQSALILLATSARRAVETESAPSGKHEITALWIVPSVLLVRKP